MTNINIKIVKNVAIAEKDGILTSGMVGVPVSFTFDSGWDGLAVTAVFSGSGVEKSVPLLGATTHEHRQAQLGVAGFNVTHVRDRDANPLCQLFL